MKKFIIESIVYIPPIPDLLRKFNYVRFVHFRSTYVYLNDDSSKAVMMTPIERFHDAYDAALKIQYSINARSAKLYMDGNIVPKYKTENRKWFSLALHRDWKKTR